MKSWVIRDEDGVIYGEIKESKAKTETEALIYWVENNFSATLTDKKQSVWKYQGKKI